jgi:hypothetical protein
VRGELVKHTGYGNVFHSVVDSDIAGKQAKAPEIDRQLGSEYAKESVSEKCARTVFMYSFGGGQQRGATLPQIRLAVLNTEMAPPFISISVGLDIVLLGLMVVYGQPKKSAEYIQATSRVGRDHERPGLVVTMLNIHKPRDRSHYERFAAYHQSIYRSVEATRVTRFSPRSLGRGLAGTQVALARLGYGPMTPLRGAGEILKERPNLEFAITSRCEPKLRGFLIRRRFFPLFRTLILQIPRVLA